MDARGFDRVAREIASPSRRGVLLAMATAIGIAFVDLFSGAETVAGKRRNRRSAGERRPGHRRVEVARKKRRKKNRKTCQGGLLRCGSRCVEASSDPGNCGGCGHGCGPGGTCENGACRLTCGGKTCQFPNASARCESGECVLGQCAAGWQNCDGIPATGCETDILTDVDHCGDCSTQCYDGLAHGTRTCVAGRCGATCDEGFASCDDNAHCNIDLRTDLQHCGACHHACGFPNAISSCQDGVCAMGTCWSNRPAEWFPLFTNCDGDPATGCEADILSNPDHCGGCGQSCPDGRVCWLGVCESPCGEGGPCRVFITAANYFRGNLGGLAGADASCQHYAELAGLPGTYMAWLSDAHASPSTRFLLKSSGPYRTVDGVTVANSWADLTDGGIAETIFVTESGYYPGGYLRVWTHTRPDGDAGGVADAHCQNWTSGYWGDQGDAGFAGSSSSEWSEHSATDCTMQKRLYCFQQSA